MPLKVGLTGGIGSGKSLVASFLKQKGANIIDADAIAKHLVEPDQFAFHEIITYYGPKMVINGVLNRKYLRELIFDNVKDRLWIENLLHPLILDVMISELKKSTTYYHLVMSPLLLETNQVDFVDRVLVIDADESLQIQRTINRDKVSEMHVRKIINSQLPRSKRLAVADDCIENSTSKEVLHKQLHHLHKFYISIS